MTQQNNNIMNIPELAQYLKIGKNTAYSLVKSGRIPYIKIGNQIRVFKDDVTTCLKNEYILSSSER